MSNNKPSCYDFINRVWRSTARNERKIWMEKYYKNGVTIMHKIIMLDIPTDLARYTQDRLMEYIEKDILRRGKI